MFEVLAKGQIRNRVKEIKTMRLGDMARHPHNPKVHTEKQAKLLNGLLKNIGWAGAALAWYSKRNGDKLTIFDAHLRQTLAPDFEATVTRWIRKRFNGAFGSLWKILSGL